MTTLTVWKFDAATGAQEALAKLRELSKQQLIQIQDAAVVAWPAGKKSPNTKNYGSMTGKGALSGAFWGMLFGLIFFVPFFGLAVGAAMGALSGKFADYGISDNFIKEVREKVTEGTSALFLLSANTVQDRVMAEFQGVKMELISSNLSAEQEVALHEQFEG
ncbi:MAG: DUF1269 domain-containing protein [Caldilinea sp.]|uniref:DUF1269 domain-containing protein n=1 Tax=Caldilinea sp. TaxID=2293560 RepID=UPI002BE3BA24|nr:DUF1269 domain-containing protein [Anaerolineales bacterium]HQY92286.1 DUF1269 domain-containing protein [Caldilinea sp.]HRA67447.1 DUF1269 domain-containing protein [Caldilinea sp.]